MIINESFLSRINPETGYSCLDCIPYFQDYNRKVIHSFLIWHDEFLYHISPLYGQFQGLAFQTYSWTDSFLPLINRKTYCLLPWPGTRTDSFLSRFVPITDFYIPVISTQWLIFFLRRFDLKSYLYSIFFKPDQRLIHLKGRKVIYSLKHSM